MNPESEPTPQTIQLTAAIEAKIALTARGQVDWKSKERRGGKPMQYERSGADYHRTKERWQLRYMNVDRVNNWYEEWVTEEDGTLIHYCAEPLSEHQKHGAAKQAN